jgi:phage/plasmid-associated DNA primase
MQLDPHPSILGERPMSPVKDRWARLPVEKAKGPGSVEDDDEDDEDDDEDDYVEKEPSYFSVADPDFEKNCAAGIALIEEKQKQKRKKNPRFITLEKKMDEEMAKETDRTYVAPGDELVLSPFDDSDVVDYFVRVYGDDVKTDGVEMYLWHENENQFIWTKSDSDVAILLETVVCSSLRRAIINLKPEIDPEQYGKKKRKIAFKLRNVTSCKNYIAKIKARFLADPSAVVAFDNKPNLLAFKNGVVDLHEIKFRPPRKEDYLSVMVPYDFGPSSEEDMLELKTFIEQVLPKQEERDCLMRCLSSCLYGKMLENVIIFTGQGRNGKDTLVTGLLSRALGGDYYYNSSPSVITTPYKGGISQERANMEKKRAVIYSEPSKQANLICANLKELTGCPTINSRGIYSKKTTIQNHGTTIILTNSIPDLDVVDNAINERMIIVPFRSTFLTQERMDELKSYNEEALVDTFPVNTYYKSDAFLEKFKLPFMRLLIEYFTQFQRDGYIIARVPEAMKVLKKEYLTESDDFVSWFYEEYEKKTETEKPDTAATVLKVKDVWDKFRHSDLYDNLSKKEKRKNNYEKLNKTIHESPILKLFWCKKKSFDSKEVKNIIIMHQVKTPKPEEPKN